MTLRSSSWVDLTENNKRRLWQWCVSLFLFILCNTVIFLVLIMSMDEARYVADFGSRAEEMMMRDARGYAVSMLGASGFRIVMTTIMAVLAAFGGYSYLNDRIKLDFYGSVPQKKSNRFSTIWISGLLIYSGPYIFSTLLGFAILNATGYGAVYTMEEALIAFCQLLLYFLGVYHLYMLAMMLTGTAFAGGCAFLVLSLYEPAVRALISMLKSAFYRYSYILDSFYIPVVSPYGLLINILNPRSYGRSPALYAGALAVFDLAVFILVFILYMNRKSEAAGKTLAFKSTAVPLKLLIGIPVVTFTGITVAEVLDRSRELTVSDMGLIIFVCIIASIVTCVIIQGIFELDIKAAFKRKGQWFVCALAGLFIFFGYKYDLLNIDRYVPAAGNVESVVFIPNGYEDLYTWMDDEHDNMSAEEFGLTHMFITDVQDVCDLHRLSVAKYDELVKVIDDYRYEYDEDRRFSAATVIYRMKNGCLVPRTVYVPVRDNNAMYLLDKIMTGNDFVKGYYPLLSVDTDRAIDETPFNELNATYSDGLHTQVLTGEELKELVDMYKKDLMAFNYNERLEELPVGYLDFCLSGGRNLSRTYYGSSCMSITIYSGMKNCISYLHDKEYDFADCHLEEEAAQIIITNYHNEEQDARAKELGVPYLEAEEGDEFIRTVTYEPVADDEDDGMDDFARVAAALHPCDRGTYRWDGGKSYDTRYEVVVYMKNKKNTPYGVNCFFVEDEIPEFVMEDLSL
ncbi:MAG: DUF6449 domain-containing protein [Lachnospiraceae bacterium]|nr:DUF6449 domain-containing protein [Lachnospiraceae bacterium]